MFISCILHSSDTSAGSAHFRDGGPIPSSHERHEDDTESSSEEHVDGRGSPALIQAEPPALSPGGRQESPIFPDSPTASTSLSPAHLGRYPRHPLADPAAQPSAQSTFSDVTPPALPPKMRKAKSPELSKDPDYSDRGDSDMDEDTCSSSQERKMSKTIKPPSQVCA